MRSYVIDACAMIAYFRDEWFSSDYRMAFPGSGHGLNEDAGEVDVSPFSIARYPVSQGLYDYILSLSASP